MVTLPRPQRLNRPAPLIAAVTGGGIVLLGFLLVPDWRLEALVVASGIPAVLAAAEPPLGLTARFALGLTAGGAFAALLWVGLTLLRDGETFDWAGLRARWRHRAAAADAPPRPPLFAHRDLGTPFLDVRAPVEQVPAERDLPLDLDQPLAAFDPAAIRTVPLTPPEPVAPLVRPQLIDPGDRFETFELTPFQREPAPPARPPSLRAPATPGLRAMSLRDPGPPRVVAPETESTVHALLARLERGIAAPPAPPSPPAGAGAIADTLGDLRRLATGAR